MNERARRFEHTLDAYAEAQGLTGKQARQEGPQTLLTDLLADALHFAKATRGVDYDRAITTARMHFEAES